MSVVCRVERDGGEGWCLLREWCAALEGNGCTLWEEVSAQSRMVVVYVGHSDRSADLWDGKKFARRVGVAELTARSVLLVRSRVAAPIWRRWNAGEPPMMAALFLALEIESFVVEMGVCVGEVRV